MALASLFVPIAAALSLAGGSLSRGLIHHWEFEGNANDSAGDLSAAPIGPVTYARAVMGRGIVLNGVTTGISLPPARDMQFQRSFSISCWAKLYSYPSYEQIWATILFDGDDRAGLDCYYLQVAPTGMLEFRTTGAERSAAVGAPALPINRFVFIAAVYDKGAGTQTLYLNGSIAGENREAQDLTPVVDLDPGARPGIGIGTNNAFTRSIYNMGWNGVLDDLRVYDRPLSVSDVRALYNLGR